MTFFKNGGGLQQFDYRTLATQIAASLRGPESSAERLPPDRMQSKPFSIAAPVAAASGTILFNSAPLPFLMRSFTIDNPTGYILYHPETQTQIPSGVLGYGVPIVPATNVLNLRILSGTNADSTLVIGVRCSERTVQPAASTSGNNSGGGGGGSNIGAGTWTAPAVQSVTTGAAVNIIPARSGRWGADVLNTDATNILWIGPTNAVAVNTGLPISPGKDYPLRTQADIWAIAQGGTIAVATVEVY